MGVMDVLWLSKGGLEKNIFFAFLFKKVILVSFFALEKKRKKPKKTLARNGMP